jgi:hypothetical protein
MQQWRHLAGASLLYANPTPGRTKQCIRDIRDIHTRSLVCAVLPRTCRVDSAVAAYEALNLVVSWHEADLLPYVSLDVIQFSCANPTIDRS